MKRMQKGFTLIELMIVVAIIGILAAVAIPQYQDYTVKAKLSKSATYVAPFKTAVALYVQENGNLTGITGNATLMWTSLGMATPTFTPEVSAVTMGTPDGAINITLRGVKATTIDGTIVTFIPTAAASAVTWATTCTSTEPVVKNFYKCP